MWGSKERFQLWEDLYEVAVRYCVRRCGHDVVGELAATEAHDKARAWVERAIAEGKAVVMTGGQFRAFARRRVIWRCKSALRRRVYSFLPVSLEDPVGPGANDRWIDRIASPADDPERQLLEAEGAGQSEALDRDSEDWGGLGDAGAASTGGGRGGTGNGPARTPPYDPLTAPGNLALLVAMCRPTNRALLETIAALKAVSSGPASLHGPERSAFLMKALRLSRNGLDLRMRRLRTMLGVPTKAAPRRPAKARRPAKGSRAKASGASTRNGGDGPRLVRRPATRNESGSGAPPATVVCV
jgi:hypothetical protein